MRWIACLAGSSVALALLLSCKGSGSDPKPRNQQTAKATQRKTTKISEEDAKTVGKQVERYLQAFRVQDFDTMWAIVAPESKAKVGIAKFVQENSYTGAGAVLQTKVETIDGLGNNRALVKAVVDFQYHPSVFGTGESEALSLTWEDEWVRKEDGQWYRVLPEPDTKAKEELEELCGALIK